MTSKRSAILAAAITLVAFHTLSAQQPAQQDPIKKFGDSNKKFSFDFGPKKQGGTVAIKADRQEYVREDYATLEGNVVVTYQDIKISADRLTWNQKTNDIQAEGNVILDQGPQRLTAKRVFFNLDSKSGTLFEASGYVDPSIYFTGEKIEKLDEKTYRLTNGIFTACELDDPAWAFHLGSGIVTVDDYARLKNLSFRVKRAPVIWTPYIVWPTKRDRAQGFLIPKIGFSNRFGAYLGNAYFVPIGQSADATLYADLYSKGYYGGGTVTRYVPTKDVKGEIEAYAVRDAENKKIEWRYDIKHTQENLPGGFRGVIDVEDFSSLEFFQRFSRDFDLNTKSNIYSSAYLTRNRANHAINIRADRREHFLGTTASSVFEQLPSLEYRVYPNQIGNTPFYFSVESSASHLRSSLGANYYRADLFPTVSMQLKTPSWLSVKPQLSIRETYYTSSFDEARQISDDTISRTYAQGQVEVVGPSFSKIFQGNVGGFNRFKHVIEPRVRYLYTSGVDTEDQQRIIPFDTVDSPFLPIVRDTVEYSVTQRVLAKEAKEGSSAREILSLAIRQTASLSRPLNERQGTIDTDRFTPLSVTAHVNPYQSISLNANATFGNRSKELDQASLSANVNGPANSYMALTWFAAFSNLVPQGNDSSQFRVNAGAPLWKDRLRADVQLNFDAERNEFLEQRYMLGTHASCYSVALEYRDFPVFRPGASAERTRDYHLSVSLKNVGTFVDLRGSLGR
jgi:LPS-assembly protein